MNENITSQPVPANAAAIGEESLRLLAAGVAATESSLIELYASLRQPLRAYLGTFTLDSEEIDDVIQEAFVRLIRHLSATSESESEHNHRGWLFRVTHNIVMDHYRNAERVPRLTQEGLEVILSRCVDPSLDPEQLILRQEKMLRLQSAVARLDGTQRRCVLLRAEGLRHKEIASALGLSTQQAAKILHRGLEFLAGELAHSSYSN